jgi:hypothetical protein
MNAKKLIATLSLLATAGVAFAQQTEYVPADEGFVSTKTRAEVVAELKAAHDQGTYVTGGLAAIDPAMYIGTSRSDTALAGNKAQAKGNTLSGS